MKQIKKTACLILCLLMTASLCLLAGCGGEKQEQPKDLTYQVKVTDALGNPYTTGVVVRFLQGGEQAALQAVDADGTAKKTLPADSYTVELMFTDSEASYYYDKSDLTLSAEKTELQIALAHTLSGDVRSLYVRGEDVGGWNVNLGSTYVELTAGERSYFLFTPTVAGTYRFSVVGEGVSIGYYGAPHFVQDQNVADMVDGAFSLSIRSDMVGAGSGSGGTNVLVIGVDSESDGSCFLNIQRTGDPGHTIDDEPWVVYQATSSLSSYTMPAGAVVHEFDLTADSYNLVLNENDGFYHLDSADGALVLVRLGVNNKYMDSFLKMMESSRVVKYFFDADGNFLKRESYSECLQKYLDCMDQDNGVYPLTEDLKYIIQQRGEYMDWWNPNGKGMYMFVDQNGNPIPGINREIAWLFMCCYITAG